MAATVTQVICFEHEFDIGKFLHTAPLNDGGCKSLDKV